VRDPEEEGRGSEQSKTGKGFSWERNIGNSGKNNYSSLTGEGESDKQKVKKEKNEKGKKRRHLCEKKR